MKKQIIEQYENDPTPSHEIAKNHRKFIFDEANYKSLATLHYRGGEEEFLLGKFYCSSHDPGDRATGANILAQLGWGDTLYHNESVGILISLLDDMHSLVINCAAVGLGHRKAISAISHLLRLVDHKDPLVRSGVVFGLSEHENRKAIAGLIKLSSDEDHEVRNWAVFGLGTQVDTDTPEVRDALRVALNDGDHEIRGEALVGLAKRKDPDIIIEILNEWRNDDISILSLEAAEMCRNPRLFTNLKEFMETLSLEDDPRFKKQLEDAIIACTPME